MIFYGTRATSLGEENIEETCPACGTPNSVHMAIFQKYAHIYWIPLFPFSKTGATVCTHCKQSLELKQMPPAFKEKYERLKSQKSAPIWTFSGLGLIAVLIVVGMVSAKRSEGRMQGMVQDARVNDVYEVKLPDKQYSLYKVQEIKGDSIWVLEHMYETNKLSGLSDLKEKGDEAYAPEPIVFTRQQLLKMVKDDDIKDIERK